MIDTDIFKILTEDQKQKIQDMYFEKIIEGISMVKPDSIAETIVENLVKAVAEFDYVDVLYDNDDIYDIVGKVGKYISDNITKLLPEK